MDRRSRKMMWTFVAAAVLAAPLYAAAQTPSGPAPSVAGKWNMSVTGPDGQPMSVTATFKQDGKKLTGTLVGSQGEVALEGQYADGKITFGVSVPSDSGAMNIGFTGTMQADGSLAGMASGPFGEIPWSATKSK